MGLRRKIRGTAVAWLASAMMSSAQLGCYGVYCATGTLCPPAEGSAPIWLLGLVADSRAAGSVPIASSGAESALRVRDPANTLLLAGGRYDFGTVEPFTNVQATFVIENSGLAPITLSDVSVAGNAALSLLSGPGSTTLAPGQSAPAALRCAPVTAEALSASLTLQSDDLVATYQIELDCSGDYLGGGWVRFAQNTGASVRRTDLGNPANGLAMNTGSGTGAGAGGKAFLYNTAYNGVRFSDLTALRYDVLVTAAANPATLQYTNIYLDLNADGVFSAADVMVTWSLDTPNVDVNGASRALNQWQTWSALSGTWWTRQGGVNNFTPRTTAYIQANYGAARIVDPYGIPGQPTGGLMIVVGSSSGGAWANYSSVLDNVVIGVNGADALMQF